MKSLPGGLIPSSNHPIKLSKPRPSTPMSMGPEGIASVGWVEEAGFPFQGQRVKGRIVTSIWGLPSPPGHQARGVRNVGNGEDFSQDLQSFMHGFDNRFYKINVYAMEFNFTPPILIHD